MGTATYQDLGLSEINFMEQYLTTALWSSQDPDAEHDPNLGEMLDAQYSTDDVHGLVYERLSQRALDWLIANEADVRLYLQERSESDLAHDLWLTENGHGAGFWDRGLGDLGQRLTDAARGREVFIHGAFGQIHADL